MRLAFISDIHGNAIALDAVLEDIKKQNIDKIYVLGDICYRGPEPLAALDLVRSLDVEVIKGNADEWVVRGVQDGEVPEEAFSMMNQERNWTVENLNNESIKFLQNLPTELHLEFHTTKIHAFHATPNSLFDVVHPDTSEDVLKEIMMQNEADVYIYGHIHKPYIRFIDGKCIINTGSVGLPFDGLNKPSYAIVEIEDDQIETQIVRVNYDINRVMKQFKESNYPNQELMNHLLTKAKV